MSWLPRGTPPRVRAMPRRRSCRARPCVESIENRLLMSVGLVSVNSAGVGSADYESYTTDARSVSANGRFVVYNSYADNLTGDDTNKSDNVFERDLLTGTSTVVSVCSAGTGGGNS